MSSSRLILLLACWSALWTGLHAQNCGSRDTILTAVEGTSDYTLNISDLLIDDLSDPNQGLCGVEMTFGHQYIYDVEMTLISPSGQSVTLIGPDNNQARPTSIFARWFIDFTSCANPASPDPGAAAVWDNNHPFNWLAGGVYQGTYYPHSGCLEDFNTGPINGQWTLRVTSSRPLARGGFFFFRLIFCDDRGIDCCFADAGELIVSPVDPLCVGSAELDFDLPPFYSQPRPDADEYGYSYLLERDGFYFGLDSTADLRDEPPGEYTICGFSYRRDELANMPAPDGVLTLDDLRQDFGSFTPTVCGEISTACQRVTILPLVDTTFLDQTICIGSSVALGDTLFATTGQHMRTLTGRGGCDSTVVLNLEAVDTLRDFIEASLCFDRQLSVGDTTLATTGIHEVFLTSTAGCDSVVTVDLFVRERIAFDTTLAICQGEAFLAGTELLTTTDIYQRTLRSPTTDCDSFLTVDLVVLNPQIFLQGIPIIDCNFSVATISATPSATLFSRSFRWTNLAGEVLSTTDSIVTDTSGVFIVELTETHRGVSCIVRDTIEVMDLRATPAVDVGTADTLTCALSSVSIGGPNTVDGPEYSHQWTGPPGAIFVGSSTEPTTTVRTPGTYQLLVTNTMTGCQDSAEIVVVADRTEPAATINGLEVLDCDQPEITLFADTLQDRAEEMLFIWSADCIANPAVSTTFSVDCPGEVRLLARNTVNGCFSRNSIEVTQNFAAPTADIATLESLTCTTPTAFLDGSGSSTNSGDIEFTWLEGPAADVVGAEDSLLVSEGLVYQLVVRDPENGCRDTAMITVPTDQQFPSADAGPDTTALTCTTPSLTLGGLFTSLGNEFDYAWTLFGAPEDTLGRNRTLDVNPPGGLYIFSVLNTRNGCLSRDSSRVLLQQDTPVVRIDPPIEFGCFAESVTLDANNTSLGFNASLTWTGPCVPTESDTAVIEVDCPGEYVLTVRNTDNGCSAEGTVIVELEDNAVVAILPDSAFIDCNTGVAVIDRSLSSPAARTTWLRDGEVVPLIGQNPLVTVPGTYTMVLSNFDASCRDSASIEVVAPCDLLSIVIPPDSLTCRNTQVVLDAGLSLPADPTGFTFEWLIDNPACAVPGANDRQILVACPGTYGFAVRNDALGTGDTTFVTVRQNLIRPLAEAGTNDTLTCFEPAVTLDAINSEQNPVFEYLWTNSQDDTLAIDRFATTNQSGIFFLRVTNTITGCNATDVLTVFQDIRTPELSISEGFLPCREDSFRLTVTPEPLEGNYDFRWNGPLIQANQDSATVILGESGEYTATVTNLDNGCPTTITAETEQLPCPPCLLLSDTVLTCEAQPQQLILDFCEPCQGCQFVWYRNGDEMIGQTGTSIPIRQRGNYRVEAVNQFGLRSTTSVFVDDLRITPENAAGEDRFLTCDSTSVTVGTVVVDTIFGFQHQWLNEAGNPLPGADSTFLRVSQAGMYVLRSRNPVSRCEVLDTVMVNYDTISPLALAGADINLNCDNRIDVLQAGQSTQGSNFRFQWDGPGIGTCLEGENTLNPIVACGGDYILTVRNVLNGCIDRDTARVIAADELPQVIPLADTVLSCAADTVWLRPFVTDPAFTTSWCQEDQFGELIPGSCQMVTDFPADSEGSYRFSVTNETTGCFNDFSVSVGGDYRQPSANAGPSDTLFCTLDSLALTGSGNSATGAGLSYSWSSITGFTVGSAEQDTAYAFQPDRYVLAVTDLQNGCTQTDTVELFRDVAAPFAMAGPDTTLNCRIRQIRLQGGGSTLSGQINYAWTTTDGRVLTNADSTTPLIGQAGTYLFSVTDPVNSCVTQDIIEVAEDTIRPVASLANQDTLLVNCFQPTLSLDASASGTPTNRSLDFSWRTQGVGTPLNGQQIPIVTVDQAGSYQLVVADQINQCADTLLIAVTENFTPPSVSLNTPPILTCDTTTVNARVMNTTTIANYTFNWFAVTDPLTVLSTAPELAINQPGEYTLELQDTINGCTAERSIRITADRTPPSITLNNPLPLGCERTLSTVTANGSSEGSSFSLDWTTTNGSFVATENPYEIRATAPGFYTLTIEDQRNGCTVVDSTLVDRLAFSITGLELDIEQPACATDLTGSVLVLGVEGGTPPYRFRLDGGILSERMAYDDLPIGTHNLTILDANGCDLTETFTLQANDGVLLTLGADTTIRLGDSIALDFETNLLNWDTLIWESLGPIPTPGANPLVIRPNREYVYELTIVDESGCTGYDFIRIGVLNEIQLFVPNVFSPNGDNRNDRFYPFAGPQVEHILSFRIFDRWGTMVHEAQNFRPGDPAFGWDGTLGGTPLNPAVFVWQLELELADGEVIIRNGDVLLRR
ncbi:MAG: gliding motility-associated C-terminal domain-containing protein [Bacteroidota bacterium]